MKIREIPLYDFTPDRLVKDFTDKEINREYKRLEKLATKRIEALERSRFKEHSYYKRFKSYLNREDSSKYSKANAIVELKKFEYSRMLTVKGLYEIRRETLKSLHDTGYNFVNEKNYNKFSDFMSYAKDKMESYLLDSERVVKFFASNKKLGEEELEREFNRWIRNQK